MGKPKAKAAGRPARTAAGKVPPRIPGATGGKMRSRTDADAPSNPIGIVAQPGAKPKPRAKRKS